MVVGADQDVFGGFEPLVLQIVIAIGFAEGERHACGGPGGVGHANQVKISLQFTILTRGPVDDDKHRVEGVLVAIRYVAKVLALNGKGACFCFGAPTVVVDVDQGGRPTRAVDVFEDHRGAFERDFTFAGVSAGHHGKLFHAGGFGWKVATQGHTAVFFSSQHTNTLA